MAPAPGRFAAALGALLLAAAALRTAWAEWAYERGGLALSDDPRTSPGTDLPGRLEAYEEAARRDPGEALYALRAAQIHLRRAAPRDAAVDRRELAEARRLLNTAAALRPMDFRVRAALAQAARLADDPDAAASEAEAARRLAPCAPGALATVVSTNLWAWRRTREPRFLAEALRATRERARNGVSNATEAVSRAFEGAGPDLVADLLQATAGDDDLRRFAEETVRAARPEVADALARPER